VAKRFTRSPRSTEGRDYVFFRELKPVPATPKPRSAKVSSSGTVTLSTSLVRLFVSQSPNQSIQAQLWHIQSEFVTNFHRLLFPYQLCAAGCRFASKSAATTACSSLAQNS
jgi:hypothetical protein